jgi:putative ABC transport system substrate-binding protein
MRRREVIALIGGAAAWPLGAYAQETTLPLIGFLSSRSPEDSKPHTEGFLRGLRSFGYIDGRTAKIEYRWANGRYDLLPNLAAELLKLKPAVIASGGGAPSARAAKTATPSIPVLFVTRQLRFAPAWRRPSPIPHPSSRRRPATAARSSPPRLRPP